MTEEVAVLQSQAVQEVIADKDNGLVVKYTLNVTNTAVETAASDVSVKAVLGKNASYFSGEGETAGAGYIADIHGTAEGLDLNELTPESLEGYTSAVLWINQGINPGNTVSYTFFAKAGEAVKSVTDLPAMFFVNGEAVTDVQWINGELLSQNNDIPVNGEIQIEGEKTINGSLAPSQSDVFEFVWADITGYNKIDDQDISKFEGNFNKADLMNYVSSLPGDKYTSVHNNGGNISFPQLVYTKEDEGQIYYYAIYEKEGGSMAFQADLNFYLIKVDLTTLETPVITQALGYPSNPNKGNNCTYHGTFANSIIFNNTTKVTPATLELKGTKTVIGGGTSDEFQFGVYYADPITKEEVLENYGTALGNGEITFPEIIFTEEGTYNYIVREIVGDNAYDYDSSYYKVTIVVEKNGENLSISQQTMVKVDSESAETPASSIEFVNTLRNTSAEFKVQKSYTQDPSKDFEFLLTGTESAPMPDGTVDNVKKISVSQDSSPLSFGSIAYSKDGTYSYEISETNGGQTIDGISYSGKVYQVRVTVSTVNQDRVAKIEYREKKNPEQEWITADQNNFTAQFENTYSKEGSIKLAASKNLIGRDLKAEEFQFQVLEGEAVVASGVNDAEGNIVFDEIRYTEEGEHTYIVKEVNSGSPTDGVTYGEEEYTVTVQVTDDGNGGFAYIVEGAALEPGTENIYKLDGDGFTNTYDTTEKIEIEATKTLTGRQMESEEFTFELKDANGNILETSHNNVNGKIVFDNAVEISLDDLFDEESGTYVPEKYFYYTIEEDADHLPQGVTATETIKNVAVKAEYDDETGELTLSVDPEKSDELTFVNTYTTQAEITPEGTKELDGRSLKNDEFTFKIYKGFGDKDLVTTGTNDDQGNISFRDSLVISLDDMKEESGYAEQKEFPYIVKEVVSEDSKDPGITYDTSEKEIIVIATYNQGDGKLELNWKDGYDTFTIHNKYDTNAALPLTGGKKILDGRDMADNEFTFMAEGNSQKIMGYSKADGSIVFVDSIRVSLKDMSDGKGGYATDKTFTYTITEQEGSQNVGITYDKEPKIVTVAAHYDIAKGELTLNPVDGSDKFTFKNSYTTSDTVSLTGVKYLKGKAIEAEEFNFEVLDKNETVVSTGTNDANGIIRFSDISYHLEDLDSKDEAVFVYHVREKNESLDNISYDNTVIENVKVGVTYEKSTGTLEAVLLQDSSEIVFHNSYDTKASIGLKGTKHLTGRKLMEDEFTFEVKEKDTVVSTGKNGEDGTIAFGDIEIGLSSMWDEASGGYLEEKDFHYVVSEVKNDQDTGIIYDEDDKEITLHASYNKDTGKLTLAWADGSETEGIIFTNHYITSDSVALTGTKYLDGRSMNAQEFQFEVKDEKGQVTATGKNDDKGTITFEPALNITLADMADGKGGYLADKDFQYTVSEVTNTPKPGITFDKTVKKVTVHAQYNQETGMLKLSLDEKASDELVFHNSYTTGGGGGGAWGELPLDNIQKVLEGSPIAPGQFTFELKDSDGNVLQHEANDKDGRVKFEPLKYTQADINREFTYTISEVKKNVTGVAFDESVYTVKVKVEDSGKSDGKLKITSEVRKGQEEASQGITFTNTFAGSVTLEKVSDSGSTLPGAQFTLFTKDTQGAWEPYVKDSGDGSYLTDENGIITVGRLPANDYYFVETQAPLGYDIEMDDSGNPVQYHFTIGIIDGDAGIVQNAQVYPKLKAVNTMSGKGSIQVTKKTTAINDEFDIVDIVMEDDTFYVNLFMDAEGKQPYNDGTPTPIHLRNVSSGDAVFSDLESGSYYVFETDAQGNALPMEELLNRGDTEYICLVSGEAGNELTLDLKTEARVSAVTLENRYTSFPQGSSVDAAIEITKNVLRGTEKVTAEDTFYAGIFTKDTDGEYTLYQLKELKQNGTVKVPVGLGGENGMDEITYYIFETDAKGERIDTDVFEYEVSGEGNVTLNMKNTSGSIHLVNKLPQIIEDTPTPAKTAAQNPTQEPESISAVKTGDDTPIVFYLLLLFIAAGLSAGIITKRRKSK